MAIKNLNSDPILTMIPIRNVDHLLHYLIRQQIKTRKTDVPLPSFSNGRHRFFLFNCDKNFNIINRLKGTALSLMKRQFIKKPKNPE